MTRRVKIYLDTSVFGGFFDKEFSEYTKPLFDRITNIRNPFTKRICLMKTIEKIFDAVKFMREQRDRLSAMFSQMTKEEIIAYLKRTQIESNVRPSA